MAAVGEVFEHIIYFYVNPVTKSTIKLVPPAECMSQLEYDELMEKFKVFCEEAAKDKKNFETIDPRKFRAWGEEGP